MESIKNDVYLVPFDFSDIAEAALDYAINLAKIGGGEVLVAHVVKSRSDISIAKIKLKQRIDKLSAENKAFVKSTVMEGSIFNDLSKMAEMTSASVVVMGSHGASGMQKLFGSNALKVVGSSSLPFLILNNKKPTGDIKNIVLPFSFARESVQIVEFAASIAAKFNSKIHLVGYKDKDEWLARDMKTNEVVVRKHLAATGVDYELVSIPSGSDYDKSLLEYAKSIDADLIAAAYFSTGVKDLFHKFIQMMIDNDHGIPVLTINSVEVMAVNSHYSFLTV